MKRCYYEILDVDKKSQPGEITKVSTFSKSRRIEKWL